MQQTEFILPPALITFLENYKAYGFKDKDTMICAALSQFQQEVERHNLVKSAEIYESDHELQTLSESSLDGWPL